MAVEFYLNGTRIYPETNTTLVQRIGTFDDGVLPMQFSSIKKPIIPMSELQIVDTSNGSRWNFVVVSDDVEVVKKTHPVLYKHNLVVRSKIYEATKHIVRNTVFSQPPKILKGEFNIAVANVNSILGTTPTPFEFVTNPSSSKEAYTHTDIAMNRKAYVKSCKFKISSELYVYGVNDTSYNNPEYVLSNALRDANVYLARYENGVLVESEGIDVRYGEDFISVDRPIFRNITDKTVFRIEYGRDLRFKFVANNSNNRGGIGFVHITMELETYYYSLYDVIDILYKQNCKTYNGLKTNDNQFLKLSVNQKNEELKSIIAPELNFTGMDYYTCLYQLFSYIDAIPVADDDGGLTYQYLNDYNQVGINIPLTDKKVSLNDEYFTNKVVANYQNGRQPNAIVYPSKAKTVHVTTKDFGIPQADDYVMQVPSPIDFLDSVIVDIGEITFQIAAYITPYNYLYTFKGLKITEVDLAKRCLESSLYESLNDYSNYYQETYQKSNCLSYTKGERYIDLLGDTSFTILQHKIYVYAIIAEIKNRMGVPTDSVIDKYNNNNVIKMSDIGNSIPAKYNLYYRVSYHAIFDGRVEQVSTKSKYEGETYVNQESSAISLNRMGNNLQGLVAKLGNEVENVSISVSTYGSRMKVGSLWYNDDGERFIANVVKTTFSTRSDRVIVEAQFSKDFNLISQFTRIDQEKRFYEISDTLTSKGYENITEYLYFSYATSLFTNAVKTIFTSIDALMTLIGRTLLFRAENYTCDYALFKPYTNVEDANPTFNYSIYIPLHIYGSGNSICFEMGFDSPLATSSRLVGSGSSSDPYIAKSTLYVNENGFSDKMDISFYLASQTGKYDVEFPKVSSAVDTSIATINGLEYFKKPNEIFHLNYALAFMSDPNYEFFFGDKMTEQNAISPTSILSSSVKFKYSNGKYSILDNKVLPNSNEVSITPLMSYFSSGGRYYLTVNIVFASPITCESWALVDENDNILIASNKKLTNSSQIYFYVIPRRNRL